MKTIFTLFSIFFFINLSAQKLAVEDFSDGVFDDFGAGTAGVNWKKYGPGTDFRAPNSRSFSSGLSNRVQAGGGGWADGAQWRIWNDINTDGNYQENELQFFPVHKYNDVCVLKFTTYSDYTYKNNYAGVEVAFLDFRDDAVIQAPPHYGHDQSWESMNCYYSSGGGKGGNSNQLETNVENTEFSNISIAGINYAHKNGWYADADLDQTQSSTVLWRNDSRIKKCNIEQWGNLNHGDFVLDTHMVALLDPTRPYSYFNYIQITFFRGIAIKPASLILQRGEVTNWSDVQIGIKNVEFGITKISDFNLDYQTTSADADVLIANWNKTGVDAHMQSGDANNDETINLFDANSLIGFWNTTPPSYSVSGTYNSSTGEIILSLSGISYFHLEGPAGVFSGSAPNFSGLSNNGTIDNNNNIGAFTKTAWNVSNTSLGNVAATGQSASNMYIVYNYKNSGDPDGIKVALNGAVYTNENNPKKQEDDIVVLPNPVKEEIILASTTHFNELFSISLINNNGQTIYSKESYLSEKINVKSYPKGLYILLISNNNTLISKKILIE